MSHDYTAHPFIDAFHYSGVVSMITRVSIAAVALFCIVVVSPAIAESRDSVRSIPVEVQALQRDGYGAASKGGEGGRVVWVSNLNDSGPGSLRAAVAVKEPRIVKFKRGGTIKLDKRILVQFGHITIDGLSAAQYGGITVQGGLAFFQLRRRDRATCSQSRWLRHDGHFTTVAAY